MATQNHNLIYSFLHAHHLNIDDWYGDIAIGFCKGIATFRENRTIKLSTYVYSCMLNELRMAKRKKYLKILSLDEDLGNGLHRIEFIESKNNEIADCELIVDFQNNFYKLNNRQKDILYRRLNGQTQRQISAGLQMSQPSVARNLGKIKGILVS